MPVVSLNLFQIYSGPDSDIIAGFFFPLRKEVIQPQVPLRLPCYDFTPIISHTLGACPPRGSARQLLVQPTLMV